MFGLAGLVSYGICCALAFWSGRVGNLKSGLGDVHLATALENWSSGLYLLTLLLAIGAVLAHPNWPSVAVVVVLFGWPVLWWVCAYFQELGVTWTAQ